MSGTVNFPHSAFAGNFFMILVVVMAVSISSCSGHPAGSGSGTLAVTGARIWTGNPDQPWAEALAVQGDRIAAVGSDSEILAWGGKAARIIEAGGRFVIPGFIDAHVHFLEGGFRLSSVQLRDAKTPDAFIERIRVFAAASEPGTWILGGDWDHELWGGELPHKEWIDEAAPRNPVWINRLDGHMALANGLTMASAGITRETPDVEGGTIVRAADGHPTGIFKDNAMALIDRAVPEPTDKQKDAALDAAMRYVASHGVTSVHHMGTWEDLDVFERARRRDRLTTRITAAVPLSSWKRLVEKIARDGRGDDRLRIGGLKGFVDGSLGSHTAAFFEPYEDSPGEFGLLVNTPEELHEWISAGDREGIQIIVHAIGDRAVSLLLDIYGRVSRENRVTDRRFRIEHAQHVASGDFVRFRELGVIASMQPYHAADDGRWAEKLIGPQRIRTTYAFRAFLDAGVRLAFGSDWYVAPPHPLDGIQAAVTRQTLDGKNPDGWVPEQKITVEEALTAYTAGAAFAAFEEDRKGVIAAGKLADFVILDRDITRIPADRIGETAVVMTVVGGRIVYEKNP